MPEDSTTLDRVELTRRFFEAASRRDLDAMISFCAPDGVLELKGMGARFERAPAIRGFMEDWIGGYEEYEAEAQEILDMGNGVTFGVLLQKGRLVGSSGFVQQRSAAVCVWAGGVLARVAMYTDLDEGRADAELLAASRG